MRPGILHNLATYAHFNPRTREGCDTVWSLEVGDYDPFQPTHPRGVRRTRFFVSSSESLFQPTHPRGVRQGKMIPRSEYENFNPRTREGCDPVHTTPQHRTFYFNPRTREGCDRTGVCYGEREPISTHAPARGATCSKTLLALLVRYFNPRTREGCDLMNGNR